MNPTDIGPQTPIWDDACKTYRGQWVRLATRWVGEQKAEGLVQDLLTRWWDDGRTFATSVDLHRLMCAAIPNRARNWLMARKLQVPTPPEELPAAAQPRAAGSSFPDTHLQVGQFVEAIWPFVLAALCSSSRPQAQAFVLRVGHRMRPRRIAELQRTTEDTVRTRITRVTRRLVNELDTAFTEGITGVNDAVRQQVFFEIWVRFASLDCYIEE